jgi:hypothetical protein
LIGARLETWVAIGRVLYSQAAVKGLCAAKTLHATDAFGNAEGTRVVATNIAALTAPSRSRVRSGASGFGYCIDPADLGFLFAKGSAGT